MTSISIPLSEQRLARLWSLAERAGLASKDLLRRRVEQLLDQPDEPFDQGARYVLEKNAELYRRLNQ